MQNMHDCEYLLTYLLVTCEIAIEKVIMKISPPTLKLINIHLISYKFLTGITGRVIKKSNANAIPKVQLFFINIPTK